MDWAAEPDSSSLGDIEKHAVEVVETKAASTDSLLDKNGLPLVPQPSRFKDDPLVCPFPSGIYRWLILTKSQELAVMDEMGCSHSSQFLCVPGSLQLGRRQSEVRSPSSCFPSGLFSCTHAQFGSPRRGLTRRLHDGIVHNHLRHHCRWSHCERCSLRKSLP